ncbi:M23 family metallopeptidase [Ruegeria arenilitoris]|uniref:M23 family metallopeptidase n=1 Tax=Ruegeria arenilitoris TaxID=1173585 RepID=UPI00147E95DC|nr:M23 family metallopeptidase [Ruegeria arenilitoris]
MKRHETFHKVNPRGTFFPTSPEDTDAQRATVLRLGRYGFRGGDYVALARTGALKYGPGVGDTIKSLWLQSSALGRRELNERPYLFRWGGERIQLCAQDSYYSDNTDPNGDYGVAISHINSRPPHLRAADGEKDTGSLDETEPYEDVVDILTEKLGFEHGFEGSAYIPFADLDEDKYPYQYRGWYLNNGWKPDWSHFDGQRPSGRHKGIDVFLQRGTKLLAPTAGKLYLNPFKGGPNNPTFGKSAVIEYTRNRKTYFLIYAHLSAVSGRSGRPISSGQEVGRSGCSGNAGGNYPCGDMGSRNDYGGRSDHVHIEVREGGLDISAPKINPLSHFRWRIR